MIYSLKGKVIYTDLTSVVIECSGVGFRCFTSATSLMDVDPGEETTLYTYMAVKEDAIDLYGFSTEFELDWFKNLISVTGVGPKAALAILSALTPDRLILSISASDAKAITKAQGVGNKIAQRVILELKDKAKTSATSSNELSNDFGGLDEVASGDNTSEAVAALTMLGYSQTDAAVAVNKLDRTLPVEQLIKQALKLLSRQV